MFKKTNHREFIFMGFLLGLIMLTGLSNKALAEQTSASSAEITVSSSSSVNLVPDTASISFSLTSQDKAADQALKMNSEAVKKVLKVLKEKGIAEKDICTTNYNIYATYEAAESGEDEITGYNACTYMTVSNQKAENIGKTMSDCISAGVNTIESVTYSCSNYDEAYQQALLQAIKDAETKAKKLAEASGKKLRDTVSVIENKGESVFRQIPTDNIAIAMDTTEEVNEPVLLPGEYAITANVTVTYRIG